ncbi:hypothetical protein [Vulcaniibacterium tengchongense]|uniref:Uncharacterized protein n=1 Tax=Vulcaniibacterium tengchongense TaxID=1273429 RepID=A0A3N4V0J7_9GAMM|nr:hypothetical protein [Vulcaniibacterium tengchongense]RPE74665.1 hypothetical protein EDC50_3194 [Vulcaniibacterium tengchongense]
MQASDDGLDFSELSDDQIVELAVALAREAMRRNPALQAAFSRALLDERERIEAAARGSAQAKRAEAARLERQARAAAEAVANERERRRVQDALIAYLRAGAAIVGNQAENMSLIWDRDPIQARGKAPKLRLNLGRQTWSLVEYEVASGELYTSPGLRDARPALLAWCREAAAAIQALGIDRTTQIRGNEG